MSLENEFEKSMQQLMQLLKKMMKQYPHLGKSEEIAKLLKSSKDSPDVNIFFLNLAPLSPEEFEELEEIFEQSLFADGHKPGELRYELNGDDLDFLKKHGIQF